jgi:hypothetical protein
MASPDGLQTLVSEKALIRLDPFPGSEQNADLKFWRLPAENPPF